MRYQIIPIYSFLDENEEIQLTVQGQTISSNFGTKDSCTYNLEQLLSSGVSNEIFSEGKNELNDQDRNTMSELAEISYKTYTDFKKHPRFIPYLEKMSTLKYYAKTNIGSRPSKRNKSAELNLSDLRAIPFVGSWSQLKQNVPGFFGVGTALKFYSDEKKFEKIFHLAPCQPCRCEMAIFDQIRESQIFEKCWKSSPDSIGKEMAR